MMKLNIYVYKSTVLCCHKTWDEERILTIKNTYWLIHIHIYALYPKMSLS